MSNIGMQRVSMCCLHLRRHALGPVRPRPRRPRPAPVGSGPHRSASCGRRECPSGRSRGKSCPDLDPGPAPMHVSIITHPHRRKSSTWSRVLNRLVGGGGANAPRRLASGCVSSASPLLTNASITGAQARPNSFGTVEESMSEVDGATLMARSLKQQGIDHLFGVVGFPDRPDRHSGAERRRRLYRHAQRAGRLLRGQGLRLSDGPARRVRHGDRPRRRARSRRSRRRAAELLADDPDRWRLGDLSRRHGRLPGGAPGAYRHAVLQVRARHRERRAHSLLRRDGHPSCDLRPSRRLLPRHARRHHPGQVRPRQDHAGRSACPSRRA